VKVLPKDLQAARYALTRSHTYISSILLSLNFIEKPGYGTLGVDKYWRCYYDPALVEKWAGKKLQGVLYHEVNHLLRDHPHRGELFDSHEKYNISGDLEINPDVIASGLELPDGVVFPAQFKLPEHMLAEEYYNKIPDPPKGGKGGKLGAGKCGSCAGNPMDGEEEAPPGEGEGPSNAEKELIKRQVAKDVEAAASSGIGTVPAGLRRWAEATLHPQVKWTKELASAVRRAMIEAMGKTDRTYKRMSRISGGLGGRIILAGWKSYVPNVALVFDTSGSMGQTDLAKALTEAKGVLQTIGGSGFGVTSISVDCQLGSKKRVSSINQITLDGGGGTDMGVGIQAAIDNKPRIDVCIVLTDGFTPWPAEPPPFKTIVVLTQAGAEKQVPTWAKAILVN